MSKKYGLIQTGKKGHWEQHSLMPAHVANIINSISDGYKGDSAEGIGASLDDNLKSPIPINIDGQEFQYIPYGRDDNFPLKLREKISQSMVTSEGQLFNVLTCYGRGARFIDRDTKKDTSDENILNFCLENSLHECFLQQATDMKYYYFNVTEIILNRKRNKIVTMRHLDSCFCRLQWWDKGKHNNVFYGDFENGMVPKDAVAIPLLDTVNPLGDLLVRQGKATGDDGKIHSPENNFKYAILTRFPTPGCRDYPMPHYLSIFKDHWYDIYMLIGLCKKYLIRNTSAPRIHIEIHEDYWDDVCEYANARTEEERKICMDKEKQNIIDFVCGPENAGKAMISGFYTSPDGREVSKVKFSIIDSGNKKEGGDWSDDLQEASNAICFAMGVHPNLVGAVPGKSQMNNSGSDKRELFNLKQALETAAHDIMLKPYHVVLHYNGWNKKHTVDVPIIQLTTLDENKSQKNVSVNNKNDDNGN